MAKPFLHTTRFRRGRLPHWEIENGRYFVTARLADSLPASAVVRLSEIHVSLSNISPQSEAFAQLQRQYFRTLETYVDAGRGACLLQHPQCADIVQNEFLSLAEWHVEVPHYSIMPNHWHALIVPSTDCIFSLPQIVKRVKGRSAKRIRQEVGGTGPLWQREWFDRWMRNEAEWEKTVGYIRNNPVKAGLCSSWKEHSWTS